MKFEGGHEPALVISLDKAAALPLEEPDRPVTGTYDADHHKRIRARIQENDRQLRRL